MIDPQLLGRYDYIGGGSDKFWQVTFKKDKNHYLIEWGKRGYSPQGDKIMTTSAQDEKDLIKVIKSKIKKGYSNIRDLSMDSVHEKISLEDKLGVEDDTPKKRIKI